MWPKRLQIVPARSIFGEMTRRQTTRDRRASADRSYVAHRRATAVTPIAFVQAILRAYEKYNADPSESLRLARIAPSDLLRPEARITDAQFEAFTDRAMRPLYDAALAWVSRKLPWGSYGILRR